MSGVTITHVLRFEMVLKVISISSPSLLKLYSIAVWIDLTCADSGFRAGQGRAGQRAAERGSAEQSRAEQGRAGHCFATRPTGRVYRCQDLRGTLTGPRQDVDEAEAVAARRPPRTGKAEGCNSDRRGL